MEHGLAPCYRCWLLDGYLMVNFCENNHASYYILVNHGYLIVNMIGIGGMMMVLNETNDAY